MARAEFSKPPCGSCARVALRIAWRRVPCAVTREECALLHKKRWRSALGSVARRVLVHGPSVAVGGRAGGLAGRRPGGRAGALHKKTSGAPAHARRHGQCFGTGIGAPLSCALSEASSGSPPMQRPQAIAGLRSCASGWHVSCAPARDCRELLHTKRAVTSGGRAGHGWPSPNGVTPPS